MQASKRRATAPERILPEYVPMPSGRQLCAYSGLGRGSLNLLVLPLKANGFRVKVKSVLIKREGNIKGKRLIVLASLLGYLRKLEAEQNPEPPADMKGPERNQT